MDFSGTAIKHFVWLRTATSSDGQRSSPRMSSNGAAPLTRYLTMREASAMLGFVKHTATAEFFF
jgi:hypothetical protein